MASPARRNLNIDIIRILATVMILSAHITGIIYERPDFFGKVFWWLNHVPLSFFRIATPLFFMISGYLLAKKHRKGWENVRHTWRRLALPFVAFFVLSSGVFGWIHSTPPFNNLLLNLFIGGGNYLYFLVGLIILYLINPYLQQIIKSLTRKQFKNIIIFLLLNTGLFTLGAYLWSVDAVIQNPTFIYWFLTLGFYLFGSYLRLFPPKRGLKTRELYAGIGAIVFNILVSFVTQKMFVQTQNKLFLDISFYLQSYLGLTVILASVVTFYGFLTLKLSTKFKKKYAAALIWASNRCFGVYLVHMIFLEYFLFRTPLTIDHGPFNPAIMIVLIWASLLLASVVFADLVRRVSWLKWMVGE